MYKLELLLSRPKKFPTFTGPFARSRSLAFLGAERTESREQEARYGVRPRFVEAHATRTVSIAVTEMSCAPRNALFPPFDCTRQSDVYSERR